MKSKYSWREMITKCMVEHGDCWENLVSAVTCASGWDEEAPSSLDTPFDTGYGGAEGCRFTVWTKKRVYFPAVYDGAEWVESVSRFPDGKATEHVGGQ